MKMSLFFRMSIWAAFITGMVSCKKDLSSYNTASGSSLSSTISALQAVGVGTVNVSSTSSADSIYVIHTCGAHEHRDSISFSSLPSSIGSYLSANYAGYSPEKAFAIKDAPGNVQGYVVVIQYNGAPVGLKFDSNGNFVSVLEQREGRDLDGPGWHEGGRFGDRDGRHDDTVSISQLPDNVLTYFKNNYPSDTLLKAQRERDSSLVVISENNGIYATLFSSNGTLVKRISISPVPDPIVSIDQSALPTAILNYLSTTYPNYVFKEAFSVQRNGIIQGYLVSITANNIHYAVIFDGSGNFLKAFVVH